MSASGDVHALEALVERATSAYLLSADLALNVQILDRMSEGADALCSALDAIADQIDSDEPTTVLLAIELLDMVLKNVPDSYGVVGSSEYLEVLSDLIDSEQPALARAREAALDFVQFYGTKFSRDRSTQFAWLLNELRKEGVKFPPARTDPWQPQGVAPLVSTADAQSSLAALWRAPLRAENLYHKIQQLRNTHALLDEQLATQTRSALLDEELAPQCRALHAQFATFLSDAEGVALQDTVRAELASLTAALAHSLKRYETLLLQKAPAEAATPKDKQRRRDKGSSAAATQSKPAPQPVHNRAEAATERETGAALGDDPFTALATRPRPPEAPPGPPSSLI